MNKEVKEYENENTTQINLLGRKYQSVFITSFISEKGDKPKNNGYFSYVELDNFGCWIVVDSNEEGVFKNKISSYIGETIIENFIANPTIDKKEIKKMLLSIHKKYRNMQFEEINMEKDCSTCSISMFVTDYAVGTFVNVGNARYGVLRNHKLINKSKDDTLAYLQYESGNILYDEIRFRKDKNIFTQRFGIDKNVKINFSDIFVLKPNDKILLYTQGAWENLDEEDIELISEFSERPGRFIKNIIKQMKKNCFLSLGNYTFCGIYVNRPLNIPIPPESGFSKIKTQILKNKSFLKRKILFMLLFLILIGSGIFGYQKIKLKNKINALEKNIVFNLNQGKQEIQKENYIGAMSSYIKIKELYNQLGNYKKIDYTKIKETNLILTELQKLDEVQSLYNQGKNNLEDYKFSEAVKVFEKAILILGDISLNKTIKEMLNQQLEVAKRLLETQDIKIKADELYNYQSKNSKIKKEKQKEAIEIYKNIAPTYKEYNINIIYNEIVEKISKYENESNQVLNSPKKQIVKRKINLPIYKGDIEFKKFRYYDSLKSYEKALKESDTIEKKKYLNGKIKMNKQLLVAVELELKGDKYIDEKKDNEKAKIYYEKALVENKKLFNNSYMPKERYNVIIHRLENKLKKLD